MTALLSQFFIFILLLGATKYLASKILAVLKVIVDLLNMLIGAEGARLLREDGAGETPQALKRRGGSPNRPRKAKRLERKSTGKFNTAKILITRIL
jgi:hypothetical protein